ncbi:unnamed protein product [Hermetia illucens]|uniref:YqaJ viral recombinase domain-containing protein n=1 Tax=Hermetia illucens TaxID=343691 RepID=A0A7R8UBZ8_HERIL|nr:uncharacterized protein LOC119646575 [Hermetia illucens]CAD7077983.1 unnamed protein product [Hermetia illucens]
MSVELGNGFRVATPENIPLITSEMVFTFITKLAQANASAASLADVGDFVVESVQIRRRGICIIKGTIGAPGAEEKAKNNTALHINEKKPEVVSALCEECPASDSGSCPHGIAFLFWMHRKSVDCKTPKENDVWSPEAEVDIGVAQIKDLYYPETAEYIDESDIVTEEKGEEFLNELLDQMEKNLMVDSDFYRHCKTVIEEFEPIYIHHTMLDVARYKVTNYKSFLFHMEGISKSGLFERLQRETVDSYKSRMWMEAQYCRIRCSLVYQIITRKDQSEDEEILNMIFGQGRDARIEDRQILKANKRQMLKQTVKLHNKPYEECGLLLSSLYPYLCASPDAISDDFIIEIKSPKTDEEFEAYLEGSGTISPKYMAQIQMQMYIANVQKALYCVLSPSFETTGALHFVWIAADPQQAYSLVSVVEDYWKNVVFPRILNIYGEE